MKNIEVIYGNLLNEHTRIGNEISDIKANNFELSEVEKLKITELQKKQIKIMDQIKLLFNGKYGK